MKIYREQWEHKAEDEYQAAVQDVSKSLEELLEPRTVSWEANDIDSTRYAHVKVAFN